tara:strand:- start:335 stop:496 length:162 start_codon:yes stop_codon:yes gene_type:complete
LNYDKLIVNPKKEIELLLKWLGCEYQKNYLHPQLDQTTVLRTANLNKELILNI